MTGFNYDNNTTSTNEFKKEISSLHSGLLGTAMFSLAILTIVGNTIVIYALRTNRHLRTVMS
jgi:hypothetical protein